MISGSLERQVDALVTEVAGVSWSVHVVQDGEVLATHRADAVVPTASIGKLLLLAAVVAAIETGVLSAATVLDRGRVTPVADSGLWQHLSTETLPLADVVALVGAVSDNLAANVLLDVVGLPAVHAATQAAGLADTRLIDRIRDRRGPHDPPMPSQGRTDELAWLVDRIAHDAVWTPAVCAHLRRVLALGTDLSMVAGGFGLDPLAHAEADRGVLLWNKTGTDTGVRVDVGHVRGARAVSYAVSAHWSTDVDDRRDRVLATMHRIGVCLAELLRGDPDARGQLAG